MPIVLSVPLHVLLCYLLVPVLGYTGIALAIAISYTFKSLMYWVLFHPCFRAVKIRETLQPLTRAAFRDWCEYLRVALPAMMLQVVEWWSFELSTIVLSFFPVAILAAQGVIMDIVILMYMVSIGTANSIATLVGNSIGMNQPELAKLFARDGTMLGLLLSCSLVGSLVGFRHYLFLLFT